MQGFFLQKAKLCMLGEGEQGSISIAYFVQPFHKFIVQSPYVRAALCKLFVKGLVQRSLNITEGEVESNLSHNVLNIQQQTWVLT